MEVAEARPSEVGELEATDGLRRVAECVGSLVPVLGGVGSLAGSDRIHDDDDCPVDRSHGPQYGRPRGGPARL